MNTAEIDMSAQAERTAAKELVAVLCDAARFSFPDERQMRQSTDWRAADEIERAEQRVAELEAAWRPISTAPRDGTRILLAANVRAPSGKPRISSGYYSTDPYIGGANDEVIGAEEGFKGDGDQCIPSNQECFTHWAPIPPFDGTSATQPAEPPRITFPDDMPMAESHGDPRITGEDVSHE